MPPTAFTLLRGLAEADRAELLDRARRRTFAPGEVVFHAGDPADALHLVRRGRFGIRLQTPFGDVATINVVGPGDAFGELALLTPGAQRSATVAALDEAETWCVHERDFRRIRVLREEQEHGAVELQRGRTVVLDADALRRRAHPFPTV